MSLDNIRDGERNTWVASLHPFLRDLPATDAFERKTGGVGLAYTDAQRVPRGALRSNGFLVGWEPDAARPLLHSGVFGLPDGTAAGIAEMFARTAVACTVAAPAVIRRGLCPFCGPCPACGGVGIVECGACDDGGKVCRRCSAGTQARRRTADCAVCFGTGHEWVNVGGLYRGSADSLSRIAPGSTMERSMACSLLAYFSKFRATLYSYDDSDEHGRQRGLMRFSVDDGRVVGLVFCEAWM